MVASRRMSVVFAGPDRAVITTDEGSREWVPAGARRAWNHAADLGFFVGRHADNFMVIIRGREVSLLFDDHAAARTFRAILRKVAHEAASKGGASIAEAERGGPPCPTPATPGRGEGDTAVTTR